MEWRQRIKWGHFDFFKIDFDKRNSTWESHDQHSLNTHTHLLNTHTHTHTHGSYPDSHPVSFKKERNERQRKSWLLPDFLCRLWNWTVLNSSSNLPTIPPAQDDLWPDVCCWRTRFRNFSVRQSTRESWVCVCVCVCVCV